MSRPLRAALAGLLAMATVMGIGRFVYTPILPHMIEEGALDPGQAGFVAGANFLGYLLGALAASLPAFTSRTRTWMLVGIVANVLTTAGMGFSAGSLAAMIVLRMISGIGSAFAMIYSTSIVMGILINAGRSSLSGLHFSGVGFGIALSASLVALATGPSVTWPWLWIASALAALGSATASIFLMPSESVFATTGSRSAGQEPMDRRLWILIVSYGLFGFGYVITATFINTIARSEPVLQPIEPLVWIVVGLSVIPSIWLWNGIARRWGTLAAYAAACIAEAVGVALSVLVVDVFSLLAAAVLLGGTFIAISALGLARAGQLARGNAARAIALMTASFGVGQMTGPIVAGQLFRWTGDFGLASLLAGAALLAAGILVRADDKPVEED